MQVTYVSDRRKKRRQRRKYLFGFLAVLALYAVLYAVQWFLFRSPLFRVSNVVVQGNNSVASADIISLVEAGALKNHEIFPAVFTFNNMFDWPDTISSSDLVMIPQLQHLSISKDYFAHTVTINVDERIPFGIWCYDANGGNNCYWFDNTGTIFEHALNTEGNIVFDVQDHSQSPQGLNQKIVSAEFLPNFLSIMNVVRQSGLTVKEIDLNDIALEEVDVITTNGPTIYFSLRFPADDYLSYIQQLMGKPGFDKLSYIDCRTEDRIYYK